MSKSQDSPETQEGKRAIAPPKAVRKKKLKTIKAKTNEDAVNYNTPTKRGFRWGAGVVLLIGGDCWKSSWTIG